MSANNKLSAKDAIFTGALGAVCVIIRFAFMIVGGISQYVWFSSHFIDAFLLGPVFMLMVAKTRKNGPFVITCLVTGLVMMAATWMLPVTGLIGGALCELCLKKGEFRKPAWLGLGYLFFNLSFLGDYLPLFVTKESYLAQPSMAEFSAEYVALLDKLTTWPTFVVILCSIVVGTVIGALLGKKLMKKHFVKAGLVHE